MTLLTAIPTFLADLAAASVLLIGGLAFAFAALIAGRWFVDHAPEFARRQRGNLAAGVTGMAALSAVLGAMLGTFPGVAYGFLAMGSSVFGAMCCGFVLVASSQRPARPASVTVVVKPGQATTGPGASKPGSKAA